MTAAELAAEIESYLRDDTTFYTFEARFVAGLWDCTDPELRPIVGEIELLFAELTDEVLHIVDFRCGLRGVLARLKEVPA